LPIERDTVVAVDEMDERLESVVEDLVAHVDGCTPATARALVRTVAAQFDDAPIQDFVPVLTAKICRDRLHLASVG
jgi:hypothetical protein